MSMLSKALTAAAALAGLAIASQAPEFAQQYRQHLGGALDELAGIVGDFDRDARAADMTREEALHEMVAAASGFIRDRGASMSRAVVRFQALDRQMQALDGTHAVLRPLIVLRRPDRQIMEGAASAFEPALPLTAAGMLYGGAGAALGALLARLGLASIRLGRRGNGGKRPAAKAGGTAGDQKL